MLTLTPMRSMFRNLTRRPRPDLRELAERSWEMAPAETGIIPPAIFLPGQDGRITDAVFSRPSYRQEIQGGFPIIHAATRAYLLRDVILADGVLYKGDAASYLAHERSRFPPLSVRREERTCALYDSPGGLRYFGQWLLDDVLSYQLAAAEGLPVTVDRHMGAHAREYQSLLAMDPLRISATFFRELVIFDDFGQNAHKRQRFAAFRSTLMAGLDPASKPGVFLWRGRAGSKRVLLNEEALASRLEQARGIRRVEPLGMGVRDILAACSGARLLVGVEGSQLTHALPALSPGAAILVIMPPDRFCTVFKDIADREGFRFGFVVGRPAPGGFTVDQEELERSIDLLIEEKR